MNNPVIDKVRSALGVASEQRRASMAAWLAERSVPRVIESVSASRDEVLAVFASHARAIAAKVSVIPSASLGASVCDRLRELIVDGGIAVADDAVLLPLLDVELLGCARIGQVAASDQVGIVLAAGAAAETGTLIFVSGKGRPTALGFLPEHCIAVLPASRVSLDYNSAIRTIQSREGSVRCINLVTGPSRTADIEEVLLLGAHGPRSLMIFLVEDM